VHNLYAEAARFMPRFLTLRTITPRSVSEKMLRTVDYVGVGGEGSSRSIASVIDSRFSHLVCFPPLPTFSLIFLMLDGRSTKLSYPRHRRIRERRGGREGRGRGKKTAAEDSRASAALLSLISITRSRRARSILLAGRRGVLVMRGEHRERSKEPPQGGVEGS